MPNWCKNRVEFTGPEQDLSKLKSLIGNDEAPISFQKIRPMPEELNVTLGSPMIAWQALYGDWKPLLAYQWIADAGVTSREELIAYFEKDRPDEVEVAHRYQSNLVRYGCQTWYDWRIKHWGTKWDTIPRDIHSRHEDEESLSLVFDTAWSPATGIHDAINELIEKSDLEVSMTWFYDEPGMQCAGYL